MRTTTSRLFGLLVLMEISSICFAQQIMVRVIDARDGRPLGNRETSLYLIYEKGELTPARYEPTLLLKTNVHGEAHFNLPEPAPGHMQAWVGMGSEGHWLCWCSWVGPAKDVVEKGIVARAPWLKSPPSAKPVPGEIIFYARPQGIFERIVHFILEPLERE